MTIPASAAFSGTFEATFDEMDALKRLEMHRTLTVPQALHARLPGRLEVHGLITKTADGLYTLTDAGRHLIRRSES